MNPKRTNFRKHRISFAEGESVFFDPRSVTVADPDHSIDEHRFIDLGTSYNNRVLVVVYTERQDRIRIISVRKATRIERGTYEEEN